MVPFLTFGNITSAEMVNGKMLISDRILFSTNCNFVLKNAIKNIFFHAIRIRIQIFKTGSDKRWGPDPQHCVKGYSPKNFVGLRLIVHKGVLFHFIDLVKV